MKKITFTLCLLFSFLIVKADATDNSFAFDSNCSVWLDTLGNDCYQAVPNGTAPFTYAWNDGSTENTACISGAAGTDVCVTITDATGCISDACFTIPPDCSVFIYVAGNPTTGHFLQAATTGVGNLNYQWSNGANTSSINPNISGSYCCTITDSNGCSANDCIIYAVTNTCSVSIIDSTTQGGNCFQAYATGVAPFLYEWSNGTLDEINCMLTSGSQECVTITDATGCTASACDWVPSTCGVDVYINTMVGAPLPLIAAAPWGAAPYTYLWSSGETTQNITPQNGAGTYCITITDNNACTSSNCITVTLNSCAFELEYVQNSFCMQATPTVGISPFTYQWSDGSTGSSVCHNPLSPDTLYCVTVTDATGCTSVDCGDLGNGTFTCDVNIEIDTTGATITLNAYAGGIAPYTYSWSNGANTPTITPQNGGTYCVTITDNNACTSNDCFTLSTTNCSATIGLSTTNMGVSLIGNSSGIAPLMFNWSTGENTSSISVTSPGTYEITITDAIGCVDTSAYYLYCSNYALYMDYDSTATGTTTTYTIYPYGGYEPHTYLWSTGETSNSIIGNSTNTEYTVTVTDALGCTSVETNYHCAVFIDVYANGASGTLNASAGGSNPLTYIWSTGETAPSISYNNEGLYCVTITDTFGCTSEDCTDIVYANDIDGNIFLDSIMLSPSGTVSARVYLIQHDTGAGTLTAIDSQDITATPNNLFSLPFSFGDLPNGDYLLKAALLPGSVAYENYLPTYHESALYWSDAVTVSVPLSPSLFPPTIYMVGGNNPGGPGFIGGLVSEGANFTASGQVETRGAGDPVGNVNILLLTENDEPITHTLTNANGEFEFPSIAWGTYKVIVEILGKDPGVKMVTISPETPNVNIDFSVNEAYITGLEDVLNGALIKVFPNPVADKVNVQLELKENMDLEVSVINLLGELILSENKNLDQGVNTLTINLQDLPAGIYFLNLSDGQEIISQRMIKN